MDRERKLEEYRRKKQAESISDQKLLNFLLLPTQKGLLWPFTTADVHDPEPEDSRDHSESPSDHEEDFDDSSNDENNDVNETDTDQLANDNIWTSIGIYFPVWAVLYFISIQAQFGTVFFIISALVAVYYGTHTRPRRKGEPSAYSVFNKNCESIDGTLKAEQLEREIRFGGL